MDMNTVDPERVRPRRDWVLVLMDPRKEKLASGIILTQEETGVEKVTEGTGHILRLGPGAKIDKLGLKVGDKIVLRSYLKFANALTCQLKWPDGREKQHFLMSVDDILMVIDENVDCGVFSGRPMNPVKENP